MSKFPFFNRGAKPAGARVDPPVAVPAAEAGPMNLSSSASFDQWQDNFSYLGGGASVTRDEAMKLTSVFACVSLMAGTIGTLPVRVRRQDDVEGGKTVSDHPAHALISDEPHPLFSPEVFWEGLFATAFLEGNAYAEIERNRRGEAIGLRPLFDATVRPFKRGGRAAYSISENGETYGRDQDDILHLRGSATTRGLEALSPLQCFGRAIGIGLDADDYAARFYKQGINPSGYISYDGKVDEAQADEIRNYWIRKFGGVANSHLPAVLSEGGTFKSLMTDPETAQLMQSRSFQVLDVARAYGVPPHMIGETQKSTSWGSGIEAQTTQFYIGTLRKHIKRFESELKRKLLSKAERAAGLEIKFDINTLLRADITSRYGAHKESLGGTQSPGWQTVNEVRLIEGLPKIEDPAADRLFVPVEKAGDAGDGDNLDDRPKPPQPPKKGA